MSVRKLLVCALLVSPLAACEEALGPGTPGSSSFVFDYTGVDGEPSATFEAEGEVPPDYGQGGIPPGDFAFAFRRGSVEPRLVVTAVRSRSDGRFDLMTLELPGDVRPGQALQFGPGCAGADCARMDVTFGVERATNISQTGCSVVTGSGRVQALTSRRVAGSFSGTATCVGAFTGQTQIQRGVFDVSVIVPDA